MQMLSSKKSFNMKLYTPIINNNQENKEKTLKKYKIISGE